MDNVYRQGVNSLSILGRLSTLQSVNLFHCIKSHELLSCRTGCKPFVEVFQNGERVFTSASHDTMDQIQSFSSDSGGVLVPLGTKVRGNVQVIIHHIRSIPIARKANLVSFYVLFALCMVLRFIFFHFKPRI